MSWMSLARLAFALLIVGVLACGDGGPTPPPGGGNVGNGTVVLLNAANPGDWYCANAADCRYCFVRAGGFTSRDTTVFNQNPDRCSNIAGSCSWRSFKKLDFRPYASARLQFTLKATFYGQDGQIKITFLSNVPGTPDFPIVWESFYVQTQNWERRYDLSLENALNYSEAIVEVHLFYLHSASPTSYPQQCLGTAEAYIRDFQIIGTKR